MSLSFCLFLFPLMTHLDCFPEVIDILFTCTHWNLSFRVTTRTSLEWMADQDQKQHEISLKGRKGWAEQMPLPFKSRDEVPSQEARSLIFYVSLICSAQSLKKPNIYLNYTITNNIIVDTYFIPIFTDKVKVESNVRQEWAHRLMSWNGHQRREGNSEELDTKLCFALSIKLMMMFMFVMLFKIMFQDSLKAQCVSKVSHSPFCFFVSWKRAFLWA